MILTFAKAMGEFGATITFVSNIPGETQTLPSAIYTFTQVPGGELGALRLTLVSIAVAMAALIASEIFARRVSRRMDSHDARGRRPPSARRLRARRRVRERRAADRALRALRLGQDLARQPDRRARPARRRPHRRGRAGAGRHGARRLRAAAPPPHRLRLPGRAALPAPHRAGRTCATAGSSPRPPSGTPISAPSSSCSGSATCSTAGRRCSPAARSSAWRSAGRCSRARASCSWTSRSPRSTTPARPRSCPISSGCATRAASPSSTSATRSPRCRGSRPTSSSWPPAGWPRAAAAAEVLARARPPAAGGPRRGGGARRAHGRRRGRLRLSLLASAGGEWRMPRIGAAVGARVRLRVRARDVMLALERPAGISALNVMPGVIHIGRGRRRAGRARHGRLPRRAAARAGDPALGGGARPGAGAAGLRHREGGDLRPGQQPERDAEARLTAPCRL